MDGWIKLHRQILNSDIWLIDKPYDERSAWIYLLLMANHEDRNVILGNDVVEIKRGSFITSEIKLMKKWNWSKTKVRSFLRLLENDGMIIKKSDHKKTTITIINYSSFQGSQTTKEPEKNHEETTEEPIQIHKQERKNEKKERIYTNSANDQQIEELFEKIWELYPNKKGKAQVSKKSKQRLLDIGYDELVRAIERYKKELEKDSWRKPQNGSTFFNTGYVDYLDKNYSPSGHSNKPTKENQFNNFEQRACNEKELEKVFEKEIIRMAGEYNNDTDSVCDRSEG